MGPSTACTSRPAISSRKGRRSLRFPPMARRPPMRLPAKVRMVEVGPRDGLQNEAKSVPAPIKIALIERLADAGLRAVEAGALVSPEKIPPKGPSAQGPAGAQSETRARSPPPG